MELTKCPLCNCPVRIARREDGSADHYEAIEEEERDYLPNPISPTLADFLRASRRGKKTVAIVGGAWTSGPWAPWGEIDIWGLNELHGKPWFKFDGVTRWFQMHDKSSFTRDHKYEHWKWLQEEHDFPIYMLQNYDDVPNSVPYPLHKIQNELIGNFYRGEEKMKKLFSSTMCYQVAQALYEKFERVELFGIELNLEGEYSWQREAMAFWMGKADGIGVDIWMPEECSLLVEPLYGYEQVRKGDTGKVIWSDGKFVK
jgi:hypothetical protein